MTGPGIRNNRKDGPKQTGGSPAIHPYNALNPLPGAAPLDQPHRGDDGDGSDGNPAQPISRSLPPWGFIAACSEKAACSDHGKQVGYEADGQQRPGDGP